MVSFSDLGGLLGSVDLWVSGFSILVVVLTPCVILGVDWFRFRMRLRFVY